MRHFLILLLVLPLFISCGYRVQRTSDLPFSSIILKKVENHTSEPGLQDRFIEAFTEEALKHGIHTSGSEGPSLVVLIKEYRLSTVSIRNDLSAEYRIEIKADVKLSLPDGSIREFKGLASEFLETLPAAESIQAIQARKEVANYKALRDLSQRIIARILYSPG